MQRQPPLTYLSIKGNTEVTAEHSLAALCYDYGLAVRLVEAVITFGQALKIVRPSAVILV